MVARLWLRLAQLLDERGLGFGYGAIIFYGLDILAGGLHRMAGFLVSTPSVEALYRPLAVWALFSLPIAVGAVALLLATRKLMRRGGAVRSTGHAAAVKVVTAGVLRPRYFALTLLALPQTIAVFTQQWQLSGWIYTNWTPYGNTPWLSFAYLVVEAGLIVLFAIVVAWLDSIIASASARTSRQVVRLAVISGVAMAILIAVARPADHYVTQAAGQLIAVSGYNILLVVTMALVVILWIEQRGRTAPLTTTPGLLP